MDPPPLFSLEKRIGTLAFFSLSARRGLRSRDSSPGEGFFSFLLFLIWSRDCVLFEPLEEGAVAAKRAKWGEQVSEDNLSSVNAEGGAGQPREAARSLAVAVLTL